MVGPERTILALVGDQPVACFVDGVEDTEAKVFAAKLHRVGTERVVVGGRAANAVVACATNGAKSAAERNQQCRNHGPPFFGSSITTLQRIPATQLGSTASSSTVPS